MSHRSLCLLAFVTPLLPATLAAQDPVFRPAREMMSPGAAQLWDLVLADLDGDGDLDLYSDGDRWQLAHGAVPHVDLFDEAGGFAELQGAVGPAIGGESRSAAALGDLDGDGNVDAYRVAYTGLPAAHQLLLGDGTGKLTHASGVATWVGGSFAVALADMDLDGDLDVVTDDTSSGATVALNVHVNAAGSFSLLQAPIPLSIPFKRGDIAVGDVDADGLPDVVIALGGEQSLVRNGPGLALAYVPGAIPFDYPGYEVELADLDGDGKLDLVCGNSSAPVWPNDAPDLVYKGDGLGGFTLAATLPGGATPTQALALADMDGDGDLDVALAHAAPDLGPAGTPAGQLLVRNDGGMVFTQVASTLVSLAETCEAIAAADIDQDGDADLVLGLYWNQGRLLLGDGAFGFAETTSAQPWSDAHGGVLLADLDGDGDLDAWTSTADTQVQRNVGNGVLVPDPAATAGAVPTVPQEGPFALAFDCNGDGALDVYQCRESTVKDKLYLNNGAGVFALATGSALPSSRMAAAGDVDGDGDADVVTEGALLINDGSGGFFTPFIGLPGSIGGSPRVVALADLDLDGDLDAVRGHGPFDEPPTWNPFDGIASPYFGSALALPGSFVATDITTFDMDADGDPDVLFGTQGGPVLLRNDLGGAFTDVTAGLPTHSVLNPYWNPRVGVSDLDADGDLDFVATVAWSYSDEKYFVYLNQSGGVFADGSALVTSGLAYALGLAIGDVDGDGDDDLVATESTGRVRILVNHTRQLAWRGLPRAGKKLALDVSGPASEAWFLALSHGQTFLPLAPYGVLQLHPTGLKLVASGVLDAAGQAARASPMPAGPSAIGLTVFTQAVVGTAAPRFTNLEIVTLTTF